MISTSVVSALIAASLASIDIVTALFAAAPGGLTEMSVASVSFGADGVAVATVQLVRVLLALVVINVLLSRFGPKDECAPHQEQDDTPVGRTGRVEDLKELGAAAPWGTLGGLVGIVSSIPLGGVIGALVGSAAFRLLTGRRVPLKKFQLAVQALAGGIIGLGVSGDFLRELVQLAWAGALIISVQMLLWLAMGWLLVRFFRYSLPTATLASSPGGISAAISTAGQAGADVVIVTFTHLMRLSTIIVVVPVLVALVFGR
jgi:membrane AbrB-like protein